MRLMIFISYLFIHSYSFAETSVFEIREEAYPNLDKLVITWQGGGIEKIEILDKQAKVAHTLETYSDWSNLGSEEDQTRPGIAEFMDVNFDNYPDILIESNSGTAGQQMKLFAYDAIKKSFIISDELDKIWNIELDKENKIIKSAQSGGDLFRYKWVGAELKEIAKE